MPEKKDPWMTIATGCLIAGLVIFIVCVLAIIVALTVHTVRALV